MCAVFCTTPVEHVWALPLIGRLTSSTDNRMKNSSSFTHGRCSPSVCQEDGISSRYQVSEQEVRMASAWNIRFKPQRQCLVTWQPVFSLSVNTGVTVKLTLGDFVCLRVIVSESWCVPNFWPLDTFSFYILRWNIRIWLFSSWLFTCLHQRLHQRRVSMHLALIQNNFLWNDIIFVNSHLRESRMVDSVALYRYINMYIPYFKSGL